MISIGLTGPTGAGKGVVVSFIRAMGYPIIDADEVYHQLLKTSSELRELLTKRFGNEILSDSNTIDRKVLGKIVFSDDEARKDLNNIVHPIILQDVQQRINQYEKEGFRLVVFDAPQLFESHADKNCDYVISVLAPFDVRQKRIMERDHITKEDAQKRMQAQLSDDFFTTHSQFVIQNNSTLEDVEKQTKEIFSKIR